MHTRKSWLFAVSTFTCAILLTASFLKTAPAAQGPPPGLANFIVMLHSGASPEDVAHDHGIAPRFVYHSALNGFSASVPELARARLLSDVRVRNIEPEQKFTESEIEPSAPWGLDRI